MAWLKDFSRWKYAELTDYYIDAYKVTSPHLGGCALHDPLAVAAAIDPSLVTTLDLNMKVDTEGPYAGRTIGDETRINEPALLTKAAVNVDKGRFVDLFMERLTTLFSKS